MVQCSGTDTVFLRQLIHILPSRMLRAYKHSTNDYRSLFNAACERLTEAGLSLYPTNCPDLRTRHPQNDIVFVTLWFQEVAGTRIEIRIDSCPASLLNQSARKPQQIKQYDANSKARWVVYRINGPADLEPVIHLIANIVGIRPAWGNAAS